MALQLYADCAPKHLHPSTGVLLYLFSTIPFRIKGSQLDDHHILFAALNHEPSSIAIESSDIAAMTIHYTVSILISS